MRYNIGDKVWVAICGNTQVRKLCPVCFGKKEVTLILGNDEHCILPCSYCAPGFSSPSGYVNEYEYQTEAKQVTIDGMNIENKRGVESIEYRYNSTECSWCNLDEKKAFGTKEEALEHCKKIKEENEHDQITRAEHIKKDQNKSYSWNAGYHLREAKRERESAERHERLAKICKNLMKGAGEKK